SNSRYRSEWRKSRRLRKLQGINLLPGDRGLMLLRHWGKPAQFPVQSQRRMAGDSAAESGLYDASQAARLLRTDCVRAGQSKSEKYLRRMSSSKGEWPAIFRDWCPCF